MVAWLQFGVLVALVGLAYRPLGDYMAKVFTSERHNRIERAIYRASGINPDVEQRWTSYASSLLAFSAVSVILLFGLQRLQGYLPLSLGREGVEPSQAFNTAVSFVTNTNWQSYSGEQTMGHLVQMTGLAVQNFVSAAVGIAVAIALVRGFARRESVTFGNFWTDLVRTNIRILLPLAFLSAILLMGLGVVQSLDGFTEVTTLEGAQQRIPGGPVASQEAIKELGTNGGGFYNANSAHPFENPTPFSNLVQLFLILVIPFALTGTFGKLVGSRRQGYALAGVMFILWSGSVALATAAESRGNPHLSEVMPAGNMEGKEVRFGVPASALYAATTTATSTGAVNSSHDSFTAFGGAVPLVNILLSEVTPGGVGSGLYGILVLALLAVFIAGLMVGRTPEYLGKKVGPRDMKIVTLYILIVPAVILVLTGAALAFEATTESILNPGPHGLSEVIYAFASGANNNGSAFAGLNANTTFYNLSIGIAMLIGRFASILLVLALAGSMASKKHVPISSGTFPTTSGLFVGLLVGVILIVAGLTYFPALSLGPFAEGLIP